MGESAFLTATFIIISAVPGVMMVVVPGVKEKDEENYTFSNPSCPFLQTLVITSRGG